MRLVLSLFLILFFLIPSAYSQTLQSLSSLQSVKELNKNTSTLFEDLDKAKSFKLYLDSIKHLSPDFKLDESINTSPEQLSKLLLQSKEYQSAFNRFPELLKWPEFNSNFHTLIEQRKEELLQQLKTATGSQKEQIEQLLAQKEQITKTFEDYQSEIEETLTKENVLEKLDVIQDSHNFNQELENKLSNTEIVDKLKQEKSQYASISNNTMLTQEIGIKSIKGEVETRLKEELQQSTGEIDEAKNSLEDIEETYTELKERLEQYDSQAELIENFRAKGEQVVEQKLEGVRQKLSKEEIERRLAENKHLKKIKGSKHKLGKVTEDYKEIIVKEKHAWLSQFTVEGALGMIEGRIRTVNITPKIGFDIVERLNLDIGPSLQYSDIAEISSTTLGLNTGASIDVIKEQLFIRAENTSLVPNASYLSEVQAGSEDWQFGPMVGLGYSFAEKYNLPIQTTVLYNLNKEFPGPTFQSLWNLKLGWQF